VKGDTSCDAFGADWHFCWHSGRKTKHVDTVEALAAALLSLSPEDRARLAVLLLEKAK
jgi:hypothetical protein